MEDRVATNIINSFSSVSEALHQTSYIIAHMLSQWELETENKETFVSLLKDMHTAQEICYSMILGATEDEEEEEDGGSDSEC